MRRVLSPVSPLIRMQGLAFARLRGLCSDSRLSPEESLLEVVNTKTGGNYRSITDISNVISPLTCCIDAAGDIPVIAVSLPVRIVCPHLLCDRNAVKQSSPMCFLRKSCQNQMRASCVTSAVDNCAVIFLLTLC